MILDFNSYFPKAGGYRAFVQSFRICQERAGGESIVIGDPDAALDVYVNAYVNAANLGGVRGWQGRWIANCADPTCHGCEAVAPGQPFMCCRCWNRAHSGAWLKVRFPKDKREIERLLILRPGNARNWFPHETVAEIRAENRLRGVKD